MVNNRNSYILVAAMAVRAIWLCQIVVFSCVCMCYGDVANVGKPRPISIKSVPFVASLQGQRQCAASVVHERFLLTAASCFVDEFGSPVNLTKALVGTDNLSNGGQLYDIQSLIPHNKYSLHTGDYNVGLVKLEDKIAFGRKVGPIKLGRKVDVGDVVTVVGWGTEFKDSSGTLRELSIPVLSKEQCRGGLLGRIISPRMLCAGVAGEKGGDCVGNEGGPVLAHKTLVAVVSPATGCGELPGLYARVAAVRGWITRTIDENTDIEI